jgi:hypothetical protein
MMSIFIGVQRYIALSSPSATSGRVPYVVARTRGNPGKRFRDAAMEDVSSFGREMIFHPRTDWERPLRFTWCNLLGSSKLDLKQSPPTLLARFVGYLDGFLGSSAKEKAKAGHESGTVASVNAQGQPRRAKIVDGVNA